MTTRASLNNEMLARLTIALPDIQVQNKIAYILKMLHDKIELNRKMNQTLEEMAQALFKSWFVDFDPVHVKATCKSEEELEVAAKELGISKEILDLFPSEFEESELGMIPKGWEAKSIKDFGRVVTGKTPPKKIEDAYTNDGKPFITPTDIDESLFVTKTVRNLSASGQLAVKNSEIIAGSICVTCIGSQMGKTTVAPINSFTNQQINSIILREDYLRNYLLSNLRGRRKEIFLLGSGGGSTMPLLNKTSFEKVNVLLPNKRLLEVFNSIVKDNIALVLQNDIENNSLSNTRNTLLPKLLSGELDVSNLHIGETYG
jgi:type I restriction enzyme S subunit